MSLNRGHSLVISITDSRILENFRDSFVIHFGDS